MHLFKHMCIKYKIYFVHALSFIMHQVPLNMHQVQLMLSYNPRAMRTLDGYL